MCNRKIGPPTPIVTEPRPRSQKRTQRIATTAHSWSRNSHAHVVVSQDKTTIIGNGKAPPRGETLRSADRHGQVLAAPQVRHAARRGSPCLASERFTPRAASARDRADASW